MKLHLILSWMLMIAACAVAAPSGDAETESNMETRAVALVGGFLDELSRKAPDEDFTYEDEKKFFGDRSLISAILLAQANIIRQDGEWANEEPANSLLGRLILSRKAGFALPGAQRKIIFYKDTQRDKCGYVAVILYYPSIDFKSEFDTYSPDHISKTILFFVQDDGQILIDLNLSSINGESIPFVLGLQTRIEKIKAAGKIKEVKVPFLPDAELSQLLQSPL